MATQREQFVIDKADIWLKLDGLPTYSAITAPLKEHKRYLLEHADAHGLVDSLTVDECLLCVLARLAEQLP